jgi:hypothetical protein
MNAQKTSSPRGTDDQSDATGASRAQGAPASQTPPGESIRAAGLYLAELKTYLGHYLTAKSDAFKLSFKRAAIFAGLGLVALVVAGGLLITAAALLLIGVASAIGALFEPDRPWVGQLIVGGVVLFGAAGATWFMLGKITARSREMTVTKYELKHNQQRAQFGHDVAERSGIDRPAPG